MKQLIILTLVASPLSAMNGGSFGGNPYAQQWATGRQMNPSTPFHNNVHIYTKEQAKKDAEYKKKLSQEQQCQIFIDEEYQARMQNDARMQLAEAKAKMAQQCLRIAKRKDVALLKKIEKEAQLDRLKDRITEQKHIAEWQKDIDRKQAEYQAEYDAENGTKFGHFMNDLAYGNVPGKYCSIQ